MSTFDIVRRQDYHVLFTVSRWCIRNLCWCAFSVGQMQPPKKVRKLFSPHWQFPLCDAQQFDFPLLIGYPQRWHGDGKAINACFLLEGFPHIFSIFWVTTHFGLFSYYWLSTSLFLNVFRTARAAAEPESKCSQRKDRPRVRRPHSVSADACSKFHNFHP